MTSFNKEAFVKGFVSRAKLEKQAFGWGDLPKIFGPVGKGFGGLMGLNNISSFGQTGANIGRHLAGINHGTGINNALERRGIFSGLGESIGRALGTGAGLGSEALNFVPGIGSLARIGIQSGLNIGSNALDHFTS